MDYEQVIYIILISKCFFISLLNDKHFNQYHYYCCPIVVRGGLGVTCSSRTQDSRVSNPAEFDGFFSGRKVLSTNSSGWT